MTSTMMTSSVVVVNDFVISVSIIIVPPLFAAFVRANRDV